MWRGQKVDCGAGQVWSQDDGGAGAQCLPPLLTDDSTAGERGQPMGAFVVKRRTLREGVIFQQAEPVGKAP